MNPLEALKQSTLHSFSLHCGFPLHVNKAGRLQQISKLSWLLDRILENRGKAPLRIVSVDVGIKNFSYCKATYSPKINQICNWDVCDLHSRFGFKDPLFSRYLASPGSETPKKTESSNEDEEHEDEKRAILELLDDSIDSKAYLSRLAVSVVDEFLLAGEIPHVITVECQRTRSNTNKLTLPNVMLNHSFEHMLYAVLAARQSSNPKLSNIALVPMNSNKMVNFWQSRFLVRQKESNAKTKKMRSELAFSWFLDVANAPFTYELTSPLPPDFLRLNARLKFQSLANALDLEVVPKKRDDLIDSLLYNAAFAKQLQHYEEYLKCKPTPEAVEALVENWNQQHITYLKGLTESGDYELDSAFQTK